MIAEDEQRGLAPFADRTIMSGSGALYNTLWGNRPTCLTGRLLPSRHRGGTHGTPAVRGQNQ